MTARKLTATYNDQVFKRTTYSDYTHVVIGLAKETNQWVSLSWASSLNLAIKASSRYRRNGSYYSAIEIIPVNK